jgi:RNA polymerase sigma-70 factor, ECF subfamily
MYYGQERKSDFCPPAFFHESVDPQPSVLHKMAVLNRLLANRAKRWQASGRQFWALPYFFISVCGMMTRNRLNGFGLPVGTIQEAVVASSTAIDRSDHERELKALVARLAGGDEHALSRLYDNTNRIVYGLALRILGDPSSSEDVTMEVYLQVWRTAGSYDPERGTVLSWLVTLVRSRAIDCLRSRRARRAELEERVDVVANLRDPGPGPELASVEGVRSRIVQQAMAQLSPDQREAIELAYFSGLSHTEVAVQTDLPLGTVKTRIRLGMLHLRKLLEPYAEGL